MMIRKKEYYLSVISLILIVGLAACVSVEKRFEKGMEMESRGRFEEAARYYIKVLEKDPTWEEARQRLEEVGAQAIDSFLSQANAHKSAEAFEEAVDALNRIDDLRQRAGQVRVTLSAPDDFVDFHEEMTAAAIDSLFNQGEHAEQAGNWAEALSKYERLKRRYPLSSSQNQRVDQARARVFIKWAEQDLARKFYRAAFDRAQEAINIVGPDSVFGVNAREIQGVALQAGTRTVAVLPFWPSERAEADIPRGMVRDLSDVLLYEYLSEPAPFIAFAEPGRIHREMRRLRFSEGAITRNMAVRIGRDLNVDFVVIGRMETYLEEENVQQEKVQRVSLLSDRSKYTTYVEQRYSVRLNAEVKYQIVDSIMRRVVDERNIRSEVKGQFRRGIYDGDYRALDLSRSERRLFDRAERRRAEQELENDLIDKLAERIADSLYRRILRFIR